MKLHTNALLVVKDDFDFDDGLFSGFDREKHKYDNGLLGIPVDREDGKPVKAASLDDPRCVVREAEDVLQPLHARGRRARSPAFRPSRSRDRRD